MRYDSSDANQFVTDCQDMNLDVEDDQGKPTVFAKDRFQLQRIIRGTEIDLDWRASMAPGFYVYPNNPSSLVCDDCGAHSDEAHDRHCQTAADELGDVRYQEQKDRELMEGHP
jgi:hypothetical protein